MTAPICPECGCATIARRTHRYDKGTNGDDWRCEDCGATFDDPDNAAERRSPMNGYAAVLARIGENGGLE